MLTPPEVPGTGSRFFYRQELMLSTVQETSPLVAVVGRCAVLEYSEYTTGNHKVSCFNCTTIIFCSFQVRPTEIAESDVFVCESIYDEHKKQIRRNNQGIGLHKYSHSQLVTPDEVYHFKRAIAPVRVSAVEIAALQEQVKGMPPTITMDGHVVDIKMEPGEVLGMMEDSLDGGPPSVGSDMVATASPATTITHVSTPATTKGGKVKEKKSKLVTGYIMYSCEVRKDRAQNNPEYTFGEISRLVGNEWRSLPAYEKQIWEERASKMNEENALKFAEEHGCPSPAPAATTFFTAEPVLNQVSPVTHFCFRREKN